MPYLTEAGAGTIGLEEIEGAVWNAIIHGASGIAYFQHNNDGVNGAYAIVDGQPDRRTKVTTVNAQVTRLAPVLNTQSYQWRFGSGLETMLKVRDGYAYIFAMIAGGTDPGARTFTLPADISASSVEVVEEGRTLTVTGGTFTDGFAAEHQHHIYRVVVSPTAPAIAVQPADRTVTVGQTATFSVTATGAAPLAYQWQKNSADITGATAGTYNTPTTMLGDDGSRFRVIVTNSLGSVTSSEATLTVLPPDTTPPTVTVTAPAAGAMVSNTVTVSATATDNVAVAGVQFRLDGANLGAEDTSSPYAISWDTWTAANGSHTLTAVARDAAGNATTSTAVGVAVSNAAGALTIAASSPAAVKGNAATLTTASFTPPAGAMLYILFTSQQAVSGITDNLGTHLTYTLQATYGNSGGGDAMVYLYTAPVTVSQAMTISVTQAAGQYAMLKVLVVTGADHSAPVGAKGGGRGVTGVVSDPYTSTAAGSLGWLLYADWMQKSIPTAGANQSVYDAYTVAGEDTYAIIRRTSVTPTLGASVTMNTTAPTTGAQISHLYFEMRPSGTGPANQPPTIDSAAWADPNPVTLPASAMVHVVASDPDGDPITHAWSRVSGPGAATFAAVSAADSGVTFSAAGVYVLRVTVSDDQGGSATSDVGVTVSGGADPRADLNHDGVVNALDLQIVIANFGKTVGSPGCDARADANADSVVNVVDLQIVISNFGQEVANLPPLWNVSPPASVCPAPSGPVVGVPGQFDTGILATNEVWDHFNGAEGANPDGRLWLEDTINQGGTQVYDPARSFLDGNGNAVLEAVLSGSTIRSGRFTSRTKFNMQYGWCAGRIKFPKAGRAWFPAFWLLFVGYNTGSPYGEIDMMEFFGNTRTYNTALHFGGDPFLVANKAVPASHSGGDAGDGFHTYWMQWEPNRVWIGVDDFVMGDWGPHSVPDAAAWDHMRQPFYFVANFAVAPSWLPAPEPSDFPARMLIDWIWYKPLPAPAAGN